MKTTRDVDSLLPLASLRTMISCSTTLSSRFRLRRVAVEAEEIRRERTVARGFSNSSTISPVSAGWSKAEVKASRTGNGVRLRICMPVICRMRRFQKKIRIIPCISSSHCYRRQMFFERNRGSCAQHHEVAESWIQWTILLIDK